MTGRDNTFAFRIIVNAANSKKYVFIFSPNPTKDFVTISGLKEAEEINLTNSARVQLGKKSATGTTFKYDISKLQPGIYIMAIIDSITNILHTAS